MLPVPLEIATPTMTRCWFLRCRNWTPVSKNAAGQWQFTAGSALSDGHYTSMRRIGQEYGKFRQLTGGYADWTA